jgi:hypothetical protein
LLHGELLHHYNSLYYTPLKNGCQPNWRAKVVWRSARIDARVHEDVEECNGQSGDRAEVGRGWAGERAALGQDECWRNGLSFERCAAGGNGREKDVVALQLVYPQLDEVGGSLGANRVAAWSEDSP